MAGNRNDDPPRPLLEVWRELNDARDGAPSELLQRLRADQEGIRRFFEQPHMRQMVEGLRRFQEGAVAQRLMGRAQPVSADQGHNVTLKTKRKRRPGAGRKRNQTPEEIEAAIKKLQAIGYMTREAAVQLLQDAGFKGSATHIYEKVWKPAYRR